MLRIGFGEAIKDWRRGLIVALLLGADTDPVISLDRLRSSRIFGLDVIISGNRIIPFSIVLVDSCEARLSDDGNFRRRILGEIVLESLQSVGEIAQAGLRVSFLHDGQSSEPSIRVGCQRFVEIAERFRSVVQARYTLPIATGRLSASMSPL